MIELHSWITIRETYKAIDDENFDLILKYINNKIRELKWNNPIIKAINGECFIEFTLFANRKTEEVNELFDFFEFIGKTAVGSYGLIYMLDDEDVDGRANEFQVYSLVRGRLTLHKDNYLSPFIPVVEDKEE